MPKVLVILFWLWVASSVCIYFMRAYRKVSNRSATAPDATVSDGDGELALDDPRRWNTTDSEIDEPEATVTDAAADDSNRPASTAAPQAVATPRTFGWLPRSHRIKLRTWNRTDHRTVAKRRGGPA